MDEVGTMLSADKIGEVVVRGQVSSKAMRAIP